MSGQRILLWPLPAGWAASVECRHGLTQAARYVGMDGPCTAPAVLADVRAAHQREYRCACAAHARIVERAAPPGRGGS